MLIQRVMSFLILTAVVASGGCGTMANVHGQRLPPPSAAGQEVTRPFGGVRRDIEWVQSDDVPNHLWYAADLPLSLIGDLVTLPKAVIGTQSDSLLQGPGSEQGVQTYGIQPRPGATP